MTAIDIRSHIEAPRVPATAARRRWSPNARRYAAAFAAGVSVGAVWTLIVVLISSL